MNSMMKTMLPSFLAILSCSVGCTTIQTPKVCQNVIRGACDAGVKKFFEACVAKGEDDDCASKYFYLSGSCTAIEAVCLEGVSDDNPAPKQDTSGDKEPSNGNGKLLLFYNHRGTSPYQQLVFTSA